ncbi:MAG: glycosyl transferase family 2 [Bacteroidetes bacterium HGW-Bacteroidetes-6]|jgi:dolichol-phosphate mannosyltransferase|nr:MAG: glycosyl transferase family 2 [Bacteroidetes bacterium HGW-Bacteroidetes-6]
MKPLLSIVVSVFNEEGNLYSLMDALLKNTEAFSCEIVLVNDGSTDNSRNVIDDLCNTNPEIVKAIHFSKNFGHEAAMIAGIDHAIGDAVICMDADLQHPPECIPQMLKSFQGGSEIVLMQRNSRGDGGMKSFFSKMFYRRLSKMSRMPFVENASDFFLISEKVAQLLRENFRERNRFLRGYIQSMGFAMTILPFDAPARVAGKSSYSYRKLFRLSYSAIAAFSNAPLNVSLLFGVIMGMVSAGIGIYSLVMFFVDRPVSGYTTLVVLISFISAVQFLLMGIMGKYIGFLFDEVKKRPVYIVDEKSGIN